MAFVHHKWHKNGRIRVNDANPNQFQWYTTVGDDENVDLGGDVFAPYVWDAGTGVARFGRSELDISAGGLMKFLGVARINRMDYTLEGDFGAGFVDANMGGVPVVGVTENEDHLLIDLTFTGCEFSWQDVPGRLAQDGNMPVSFRTQLRIQSGNTLRIAQYITSPIAHDIRIRFENNGMDRFSGTEDKRDRVRSRKTRTNPDVLEDYVAGTEIGNMVVQWSQEEADLRTITVTAQGQKRNLEILMGPYSVQPGIELEIFPDTWAAGEISTDTDDGNEENVGGGPPGTWSDTDDGDGYRVSGSGTVYAGMRWDNMPAALAGASSIDTGTKITFDCGWNGDGGPPWTWDWYGVEHADPATWGSSNLPSDHTWTTATAAESQSGSSPQEDLVSVELNSIVDEIRTSVTWVTGSALSIVADGSSSSRYQIKDSSGLGGSWNAVRLTVTYTAAGGGLFMSQSPLDGLGVGGPFFRNPMG